jgi:hypothetical protein
VVVLAVEEPGRVYVKCVLRGEPARIFRELKERGVVGSVREALIQGLLAVYERTLDRDLRRARVLAGRRLEEDLG